MRLQSQRLSIAAVVVVVVGLAAALAWWASHRGHALQPGAPVIMVVGDSLADGLASGLRRLDPPHQRYTALNETRLSSGLAVHDAFDWPPVLARLINEERPAAIVILLGLNDARLSNMPGGDAAYRRRIDAMLDAAASGVAMTIWVGLPVMRDPGLDRNAAALDALVRERVTRRPSVRFLDIRTLTGDADGAYMPFRADQTGNPRLFREPDGIHFTSFGYDEIARQVLTAIAGAVPGLAAQGFSGA